MIFFFFKPLDIKNRIFTDVPLFEINSFVLYELNTKSLETLMNGTKALRYTNRYVVKDIDYTDNAKEYIANMKAKNGLYKDDIVYLDKDVVYTREDGLVFKSQKAVYNKKTTVTHVDTDYVAYQNKNKIVGNFLVYNNAKRTIKSANVVANYQLTEDK